MCRWADDTFVQLTVGDKGRLFHVYKRPLCNASEVFDAAFNGEFREKSSGSIHLVEDTAETVDLFLTWLYQGELDFCDSLDEDDMQQNYRSLIDLYMFADKYGVKQLEYYIVKLLMDMMEEFNGSPLNIYGCPDVATVEYVYANTTQRSSIRTCVATHLVSAIIVCSPTEKEDTWEKIRNIPDLAVDMAMVMASRIETETRNRTDPLSSEYQRREHAAHVDHVRAAGLPTVNPFGNIRYGSNHRLPAQHPSCQGANCVCQNTVSSSRPGPAMSRPQLPLPHLPYYSSRLP
ncbi:MAG: hypothetical protein Q9222_004021 [Ikaeria aurantiellina]